MKPSDFNNNTLLPQSFYARDALIVAQELLGKIIRSGPILLRITETESYCWPDDSANHSFRGKTAKNVTMWGPPGHLYVYLCYGLHNMINFVTNETDIPAAVLIRSCEALYGLDIIQERRQRISSPDLLSGPGKVGQALAFTRSACGHALFKPGTFEVHNAAAAQNIIVGPRVGIDYAAPKDRDALYRFADGDSFCVTKRSALRKPQEANF